MVGMPCIRLWTFFKLGVPEAPAECVHTKYHHTSSSFFVSVLSFSYRACHSTLPFTNRNCRARHRGDWICTWPFFFIVKWLNLNRMCRRQFPLREGIRSDLQLRSNRIQGVNKVSAYALQRIITNPCRPFFFELSGWSAWTSVRRTLHGARHARAGTSAECGRVGRFSPAGARDNSPLENPYLNRPTACFNSPPIPDRTFPPFPPTKVRQPTLPDKTAFFPLPSVSPRSSACNYQYQTMGASV